jgi:hypothetical protein
MGAINRDVVLVAEGWDRQIDTMGAVVCWLGLGVFDCPARIAILLREFGRPLLPAIRNAAFTDLSTAL